MTQSTVLVFLQVILFSTQVNGNNQFEPPDLFSVLRSCCTFGKQLANPGRQFGTCSDFQVPIPNVPLEFQACYFLYFTNSSSQSKFADFFPGAMRIDR